MFNLKLTCIKVALSDTNLKGAIHVDSILLDVSIRHRRFITIHSNVDTTAIISARHKLLFFSRSHNDSNLFFIFFFYRKFYIYILVI